jgi:NADPH2:quinone reductase
MSSYKAVILDEQQAFKIQGIERSPLPLAPYDVRIQVKAFGINQADLLQRIGRYPAPFGFPQQILGLEFSGEILDCGVLVTQWQAGDRVMGIVGGGAYQEELICHERELLPIPKHQAWAEAAAIPEAFLTAFDALKRIAMLQSNQRVYINAIGSGVGSAAAQMASYYQAQVYGSSRQAWKLKALSSYLDFTGECLDSTESIAEFEVKYANHFDVIIDFLGAQYLNSHLKTIAYQGKMVCIGLLSGMNATLPMTTLLQKRLSIEGTVLRSRSIEEKISLIQCFKKELLPAIEAGKIKPILSKCYTVAEIETAHLQLKNNEIFGKIVVTW